jgi:hypothetical protein
MLTSPIYTLWDSGPVIDLDKLVAIIPATNSRMATLVLMGAEMNLSRNIDIAPLLWSWNCWRVQNIKSC